MFTRKLEKSKDYQQFSEVSSTAFIHDAAQTTFQEDIDIFGTFNDEGVLISQIECDIKTNLYCGVEINCAAVGGVASRPEYRRLGGVRATFNTVFENAINKNCAISILYPFSLDYYRKFGYENILRYIRAECSFKALEKINRFTDVTLATETHKNKIIAIYKNVAEKHNLMFGRNNAENLCLTPYNSMEYTYFVNDSENSGYVFLHPDRSAKTITVKEIGFTNKSVLLKLLGFLRTFDGNYDSVIFEKLPIDTPIFNLINDENKLVTRQILNGGAARIIDIEIILKTNKYPKSYGKFSIKITDDQIEKNNGIFTVEYENNVCTVTKNKTDNFDICSDILTASRILLSGENFTAEELQFLPGIEVKTNATDFLRAFPKRSTIFYDNF